jgi:peptide/nickel transport system substrate-binding protein
LSSLLSACARQRAPAAPALRIGLYEDPLTLDPHRRNELLTLSVLHNLYEALTAFDAGTKIGPALAESWENPNELTWIFHLRSHVHFHDGREFTADDVVASITRARNSPNSNVSNYLVAIDKVTALDAGTVMMTTTRPYPILLNKLAFVFIVPSDAPPEIRQPIGTGPYRLVSYEVGKRLTLQAFDGYWGGVPEESKVEFLPIKATPARVQALLSGELDVAQEPAPADLQRIRAAPGCRVIDQDSLGVVFLLLRRDRPPFTDARVRRAIHLALDRRALVHNAQHDEGVPVGQMVGRNVFGFDPSLVAPAADVAKARQLLAEAGFASGLDLDLYTRAGRHSDAAELQRQLLAAGIRLHVIEQPWASLFPHLLAGDVNFYLGGWFCLSGDASDFFDSMVHSRGSSPGYGASNFNHYDNPQLDALIEQSGSTLDLPTRRTQLEGCMRALMDDLTFIPLYSPLVFYGARTDLDWQLRRDGLILANTIHRHAAGG